MGLLGLPGALMRFLLLSALLSAGTAAFRQWWHEEGVPAGGRLVYNTGRALDLFEQLLQVGGWVGGWAPGSSCWVLRRL